MMNEVNLGTKNQIALHTAAPGRDLVQLSRDASGKVSPAEVAKSFEQIFIQQMVKEMNGSLEHGFFGTEEGAQVYQGLFETFLSQKISDSGGLGMAKSIEQAIHQRQQEVKR